MKVTLKDIAEDTGYSISTVSRVLNGFDSNEDTKKEIIQSARKLNYPVQNYLQDGTDPSGSLDILLVTGIEVGEFYASFFDGINKAASRQKVRLSLSSLENRVPSVDDIVTQVREEGYDGLILNVPKFTRTHYQQLRQVLPTRFPVISNEVTDQQVFDTVGFDNYGGGHLVARHFFQQKYDRCGIILGPRSKNVSRQRAHGFKDFIAAKPIMSLEWTFEGDFTFESGLQAFTAFEKLNRKPRAIFACNDTMCHAFMQEAMVRGYTFPDDIAVVGFDDLPICSRHRPRISSVHTNYEDLGLVSIQKMKERINNPDSPHGMLCLVPTRLVRRESS